MYELYRFIKKAMKDTWDTLQPNITQIYIKKAVKCEHFSFGEKKDEQKPEHDVTEGCSFSTRPQSFSKDVRMYFTS